MGEAYHYKYIVFNRELLRDHLIDLLDQHYINAIEDQAIKDAVVIRRQDQFASPCLLTYASMISLVAEHHPDKRVKQDLEVIADYFHEQGVLAGEEGWKLPTP